MNDDKTADILRFKLDTIIEKMNSLEKDLRDNYVRKEKFCSLEEKARKTEENISKAVWIVLTLVISAVVYLVLKK